MQQIIVIKRKAAPHGVHSGAWKVAYADFVTALMALFIVLWLMTTSKAVQQAIQGYFRDPSGTAKLTGTAEAGSGQNFTLKKDDMPRLKEQLEAALRRLPDFEKLKSHIEITLTSEGLRIELLESDSGTFFETGKAQPTASGRELLGTLAHELGKLPNKVSLEGHTDARPYRGGTPYSNWELSTDRANVSRRYMQQNGLKIDQVTEVRGFADQKLRNPANPNDAANRRISLLVKYTVAQQAGTGENVEISADTKAIVTSIPEAPAPAARAE